MQILEDIRCFDGRQLRVQHASVSCQCDMIFSVFLPPQAATHAERMMDEMMEEQRNKEGGFMVECR